MHIERPFSHSCIVTRIHTHTQMHASTARTHPNTHLKCSPCSDIPKLSPFELPHDRSDALSHPSSSLIILSTKGKERGRFLPSEQGCPSLNLQALTPLSPFPFKTSPHPLPLKKLCGSAMQGRYSGDAGSGTVLMRAGVCSTPLTVQYATVSDMVGNQKMGRIWCVMDQ